MVEPIKPSEITQIIPEWAISEAKDLYFNQKKTIDEIVEYFIEKLYIFRDDEERAWEKKEKEYRKKLDNFVYKEMELLEELSKIGDCKVEIS